MASKKDKEYIREYLKRNVQLNRAIEGQSTRIRTQTNEMYRGVINKIEEEFPKLNLSNLGSFNRTIVKEIEDYFSDLQQDTYAVSETIVSRETAWHYRNFAKFIDTELSTINPEITLNRAVKKTYQGHTFEFWFKQNGKKTAKKVVEMLRHGYLLGSPPAETARQIQPLVTKSVNDVRTLSRSFFQHAAMETREDVLNQNQHIIEDYIWVSTLDARTTPQICGIRDGLRYSKDFQPIGHGLDWDAGPGRIHWNCRSSYIARLKGQSKDIAEEFSRPAFGSGKEYERGDNKTRTGRIRKPTRRNVENGIYKFSQVKGSTLYEDWLRKQNTAYISDVLNAKVAKDFKSGKISLMDFVKMGESGDINNL